MKREIKISYWWKKSDNNGEVLDRHADFLEESAQERIFEMLNEGYTSGELFDNIHSCDEDTENGVDYHGAWESTFEEVA
ncbi:hypothetical protein X824_gp133 [Escherichia phage 4MG]|uniref:Hyphothetical protein n=1 Tax=Escherichia phage 4MG TaxID=1391428 RepID=V5KSP5_9CAUD|nr:hypothetical protein X824_gp133 [Escherichia phage 4MG]AGZ17690.1 hyphothetical protein [Escherichia phage 4MG]